MLYYLYLFHTTTLLMLPLVSFPFGDDESLWAEKVKRLSYADPQTFYEP